MLPITTLRDPSRICGPHQPMFGDKRSFATPISLARLKRHLDGWKSTIGVFGLGYVVAVELVMRFVARCVPINVNAWDRIRTGHRPSIGRWRRLLALGARRRPVQHPVEPAAAIVGYPFAGFGIVGKAGDSLLVTARPDSPHEVPRSVIKPHRFKHNAMRIAHSDPNFCHSNIRR